MEENKKFYQKERFTILILVLFWPIGLIIMWSNKTFNMTSRIVITIFFTICIFIGISNKSGYDLNNKTSTDEFVYSEQITEQTTEITTENMVNISNDENNISSADNVVYIGATGTKYHRQSCSTLKGKGKAVTLNDALSQGKEPCKRCKP